MPRLKPYMKSLILIFFTLLISSRASALTDDEAYNEANFYITNSPPEFYPFSPIYRYFNTRIVHNTNNKSFEVWASDNNILYIKNDYKCYMEPMAGGYYSVHEITETDTYMNGQEFTQTRGSSYPCPCGSLLSVDEIKTCTTTETRNGRIYDHNFVHFNYDSQCKDPTLTNSPSFLDVNNAGIMSFFAGTGTVDTDWEFSVADISKLATGSSMLYDWDGRSTNFKSPEPTTNMTASVTMHQPNCNPRTANTTFDVINDGNPTCNNFFSSADVGSGNINHTQPLFEAGEIEFDLNYNSKSNYSGPLGSGWSHPFNMRVTYNPMNDSGKDSYTFMNQSGDKVLLIESGIGVYRPVSSLTAYPYLLVNPDYSYSYYEDGRSEYNFDNIGRLISIKDKNQNLITLTYDVDGRLERITDSKNRVTTITSNAENRIASITDPNGNTHSFIYGIDGTLSESTTVADGYAPKVWTYTYIGNAFMQTKRAPSGNLTTYTYDSSYRVINAYDSSGEGKSIVYPIASGGSALTTTITAEDGGVWVYNYDSLQGTLTSKQDPEGNLTSYTYTEKRDIKTETSTNGGVTTFTYDYELLPDDPDYNGITVGAIRKIVNAKGQITKMVFNNYSDVTTITDANGNTTAFTYYPKGNIDTVTDAKGNVTKYTYTPTGEIETITNPLNLTTTFGYDASRNLSSITDPYLNTTQVTSDSSGNMTALLDPKGNLTQFSYDSYNQLKKTTDAALNETLITYDAFGNTETVTDANGNKTTYAYTLQNKLKTLTDSLNQITNYSFAKKGGDGESVLTSLTDAKGNATSYFYDKLARIAEITSAVTATTNYQHNTHAGTIKKTDANGAAVTYSYDKLNRLTFVEFADPTQNIQLTYDTYSDTTILNGAGRLTQMVDPTGTTSYYYDSIGNLIKEVRTINSVTYTTSYSYDAVGNITQIVYPGGRIVDYGYIQGRVLSVIGTKGGVATNYISSVSYDSSGLPVNIVYGNTLSAFMTYNNLNQLQNKTLSSISNVSYTYDKTGNIKTITDNIDTQKSQSFIYDPLYRVTNATGVYGNVGYTYDPIGNRLKEDMIPQPPDDSISYQYNHNNQITKAIKNGVTVGEYFYDGTGKRIKKIANGETTIFHYDVFGNIISETDANGVLKNDYVYLKGSRVVMVSFNSGAEQTYYYLNNHIEIPVKMTDPSGAVVWQGDYYPFGEIYQQIGTVNQPFRFPGQYYDSETGLYYNYHRYYGPEIGRYLTADPIGLKGGGNLFVYSGNNPGNWIDPFGLFSSLNLGSLGNPGILDPGNPNGNWGGDFTTQDGGRCSFPGGGILNSCLKKCCKEHDKCFEKYKCNVSSWIGNIHGDTGRCQVCNWEAFDCFFENVGKSKDDCSDC